MERRLAAIMAADVVGYSRMMGEDEAATLAAFNDVRDTVFEPLIASHRGAVIKRMGDGWLVEFASALDAVKCAIATQDALANHRTIRLRIGIHLGDVMHDDEGDIHGGGVNVAARLEGVADPRGVVISDQVYNALDGTMTPAFGDGGALELKNIARRIPVWKWRGETATNPLPETSVTNAIPLILLEDFGSGGDTDAATDLALDLQSGLLDALSHRPGVRVATPSDGGEAPTYLLKGRCQVSGDRCRLHISVTVAANGETFWTTKIDGEMSDTFSFIDDVVDKVGAAIRVHVNAYAGAVYASRPDQELTLQQLLAKAAFLFHRFDAKGAELSRRTMAAAVAIAPEDPMTLAMHSYAMFQTIPLCIERIEDIDVEAVMSYADKSVYFGPNVDFAFHNRSRTRLWLRRDHDGCIMDAKRSLAINPGYHLANEDLALADIFGGDVARGLECLEETLMRFPAQPITPYRLSILGLGYAISGDTTSALRHALDGYERRPLVRIHALAYAAAASGDASVTGSPRFRDMVAHHGLSVRDADRFPFAREADTAALADMLRRSRLPD